MEHQKKEMKKSFIAEQLARELEALSNTDRYQRLPAIAKIIRQRVGIKAIISSVEISARLKEQGIILGWQNVRKYIRLLRMSGEIKYICGGKFGYFVAADAKELKRYMDSNLRPRTKNQLGLYFAMELQQDEMTNGSEENNFDNFELIG